MGFVKVAAALAAGRRYAIALFAIVLLDNLLTQRCRNKNQTFVLSQFVNQQILSQALELWSVGNRQVALVGLVAFG